MGTAWENLVNLNNQNKEKNKKSGRYSDFVFKVIKEDNRWYLYKEKNDIGLEIQSYTDILNLLKSDIHEVSYISNISILKGSYILGRHYIQKDWLTLYGIIRELIKMGTYKTLKIIKVDNVENYIAKLLLLGKNVVHITETYAYSLITLNDTLLLISELTFVIDTAHYIRFSKLDIENLYINNLDISELLRLDYFFANMQNINTIQLENFDTRKVRNFRNMFDGNINLKNINITSIETDSAVDMRNMFSECRNLSSLNLSHFKWNNVTIVENMFLNCYNLVLDNLNIPTDILLRL